MATRNRRAERASARAESKQRRTKKSTGSAETKTSKRVSKASTRTKDKAKTKAKAPAKLTPAQRLSMSVGGRAVRLGFNPSKNADVEKAKTQVARMINDLDKRSIASTTAARKRLFSLAKTAYEEGAMWHVKALTEVEEEE